DFRMCLVFFYSMFCLFFFFSSRRRHTRCYRDWSSDVCSSDLLEVLGVHLWLLLQRLARSPRGIPSGFPWITSYDSSTTLSLVIRSEERRVGKECRSRLLG